MLGKAGENVSRIQTKLAQMQTLRDRFETDFGFIRSEKYAIPKKEGDWDSFTTNRPSTDAYKIINALATARLKIWVPITDENEKERANLSATERFVYGCLSLRDNLLTGVPEALPLQAAISWHAPMRGWLGLLVYLYEADDGRNGKVIPHIANWDIFNSSWISGSRGLLWAANKRYASPEDVKVEYKEEVKPDSYGRVSLYDVWDKEEHGVIGVDGGGRTKKNGWVLKPEAHGLNHVPVLILPGGSTPFIQSEEFTDTIKNVGESIFADDRLLFDTESRMGSYLLTFAGRAAKMPIAHEWDSTKTAGGKFPAFQGSPSEKGAEIAIDIGKGEKVYPLVPPEMTRDFFSFFDYLQGRLIAGGRAPVAFGQTSQMGPAAGIRILRHASMEAIKPPQQLMERSYAWLAHELVSQYKNGKFGEMEIQGIDGSDHKFKMKVKPEDIDDSWQFEAKLIADFPQDDMADVGMAVQLHTARLLSDKTIRDRILHVQDTDLEQRKLDMEQAYQMHFINARHLAAVLADKGDLEGAQFILDDIEQMKLDLMTKREPGIAPQAGIQSPVMPSADTSAVVPTAPTPTGKGMKRFLNIFGGGGR